MFDNKKLIGLRNLLAKILIAGSIFSCLTVNVLRKTLLLAFLNRRVSLTMPSAQSNNLCSDRFEAKAGGLRFSFMLFLFVLLMGVASTAKAGLFCSGAPFNGVVDGNKRAELGGVYAGTIADPFPTQITIDTECTFQNFTASNPLTATLNFQTNDPSVYLITFNKVINR